MVDREEMRERLYDVFRDWHLDWSVTSSFYDRSAESIWWTIAVGPATEARFTVKLSEDDTDSREELGVLMLEGVKMEIAHQISLFDDVSDYWNTARRADIIRGLSDAARELDSWVYIW